MGKRACTTILFLAFLGLLAAIQSSYGIPGPGLLIDETTLTRLRADGEIEGSLSRGAAPELIPQIAERADLLAMVQQIGLTTGVELLRLYEGEEDFSTPAAHLRIYNILRSISSMTGLEYYSASRKRMRTLFAQSYVVDSAETQLPQPDPVAQEILADSSLVIFQEDLTFGKNLYRSRFRYGGGYFLVDTRNLTIMRYLLMPMVQPGDSFSVLLLIPDGNRILFYGATGAHTLRFFGLERSKEDSSYNRLQALYGWFTRRLEQSP